MNTKVILSKRLLVPVSVALIFFLGFESGSFQLVLLRVTLEFDLDRSMMGLMVAAQFFAIMLGPLIFGRIADKIGKKKILLIFVPIFTIGCFLTANASGIGTFVLGVFIIGMGYSVCECIVSAMLVDNFPNKAYCYLNISQSGYSFGAVIGPLISVWLINEVRLGWRAVFIVTGIGCIMTYPFLCMITNSAIVYEIREAGYHSTVSLLKNKYFVVLLIAIIIYVGFENGVAFFVDAVLTLDFNKGNWSAYVISLFWLSQAISRIVFSVVRTNARKVMIFFFFTSAVLFFLLALTQNRHSTILIIALIGFLSGPAWTAIMSEGTGQFPQKTGAASGIISVGGGFGGAVVPMLIGFTSEVFGFKGSYIMLATLSIVVICLIKKTKGLSN